MRAIARMIDGDVPVLLFPSLPAKNIPEDHGIILAVMRHGWVSAKYETAILISKPATEKEVAVLLAIAKVAFSNIELYQPEEGG